MGEKKEKKKEKKDKEKKKKEKEKATVRSAPDGSDNQYTEENFNGIYCGRDALLQLLLLLMLLLLCSIIVKDTDEQYIELSGLHSTVGDGDE